MKTQKKTIILFLWIYSSLPAFSQHLMGKITEKDINGKESYLPMAGIKWHGTNLYATSDSLGNFHIMYPDSMPSKLIVSLIGYTNDTIAFADRSKSTIKIVLKNEATTLSTVNITEKQQSTSNLITSPINTELISQKELTLAACCNLSESFERNASVDMNFTDAVSGTKQIQMLGLDGIYTQILYENLPFVHGLSSSYGLSYIPGPWVEKILVTKGTGSVVNGFESITGQIQIELLEPDKADKFFVNGYANSEKRFEINSHFAHKFNEHLSTLLFVHANKNNMSMDKNHDTFMDLPLIEQYNFLNRWHYRTEKMEGQFGIRALTENKMGGQMMNESIQNPYMININTNQFETFTKNGLLFPDRPYKSMALMTTERYQKQDATFGLKKYSGEQKSLYLNTIDQTIIGTTFHKIKFGGSLVLDNYNEKFSGNTTTKNDSVFNTEEIVPGVYTEYTYSNDSSISLVAGLRADYYNLNELMIDPRLHFKYNLTKNSAFRLSGGRGFRTPHIFAENSQALASSREISVKEKLLPEVAWNYGATFTQKFKILNREASFNMDFFRTDFQNQVVVDLEDVRKVQFYNLKGISYSNAFQTDFNFSPMQRLDIKIAYKNYDVKTTYNGTLTDKPFVPKNRALLNIDYATNFEKWKFDLTVKWFGKSRLPNTSANAPEFQMPSTSDSYYTLMAQVTKKFRWVEVYLGAENLLNFTIPHPIIDPENPFGTNFDATMIWGPITGRMVYGGIRYTLK